MCVHVYVSRITKGRIADKGWEGGCFFNVGDYVKNINGLICKL